MVLFTKLGFTVSIICPIILGISLAKSSDLNFPIICLIFITVVIISMRFRRVFSSLLHYMLPRKRPVEGEAVDGVKTQISSCSGSDQECLLKKQRIENSVFSTSTEDTSGTKAENSGGIELGSSSNGQGSCERSVTDMAFDDGNPHDIDEDLHSRQLAVYGRDTMRRLFASNVLISGIQGLGAEIGNGFPYNFHYLFIFYQYNIFDTKCLH